MVSCNSDARNRRARCAWSECRFDVTDSCGGVGACWHDGTTALDSDGLTSQVLAFSAALAKFIPRKPCQRTSSTRVVTPPISLCLLVTASPSYVQCSSRVHGWFDYFDWPDDPRPQIVVAVTSRCAAAMWVVLQCLLKAEGTLQNDWEGTAE